MVRCKKCRSRFIEKNLYERHLRDKHSTEYIAYLIQQEEEIAEQRYLLKSFSICKIWRRILYFH